MAAEIEIRRALPEDAERFAPVLRAADIIEAEAIAGGPVAPALRRQLARPGRHFAVTEDGRPLMLFGATPLSLISDECHPWMLCTDGIARHHREVLRHGREILPRLLAGYRLAWNVVDDANLAAVRYIAALGFRLTRQTFGVGGRRFRRFEMEVAPCASRRSSR